MKVQPIRFDPAFSVVPLAPGQLRFHADVSFRGLVKPGVEIPLVHEHLPGLRLGDEALTVWVMDPAETMAEKILGWCAHGSVKHYVDVAWIGKAPTLDQSQWGRLAFLKGREPGQTAVIEAVRQVAGRLRRAQPR
jgi:hypothetical protein